MRGMTTATPTPSHPDGSIDCEVRDAVLLIGINRPAKRNGFTPKMYRELGEAYTRLDDDPALRVGDVSVPDRPSTGAPTSPGGSRRRPAPRAQRARSGGAAREEDG